MEDTLQEIDKQAESLGSILQEHNGQNVCVLDLRGINNWTDFFIIATATSKTHIDGLEKHVKEFCFEKKIEIFGSSRRDSDDEWRLLDLGTIIIHLMTSEVREFYELEKLWTPVPTFQNRTQTVEKVHL